MPNYHFHAQENVSVQASVALMLYFPNMTLLAPTAFYAITKTDNHYREKPLTIRVGEVVFQPSCTVPLLLRFSEACRFHFLSICDGRRLFPPFRDLSEVTSTVSVMCIGTAMSTAEVCWPVYCANVPQLKVGTQRNLISAVQLYATAHI